MRSEKAPMRSSISGLKCLIRPWKTHPQPVSTTAYTALHYILGDYIHTFMQILLELGVWYNIN